MKCSTYTAKYKEQQTWSILESFKLLSFFLCIRDRFQTSKALIIFNQTLIQAI